MRGADMAGSRSALALAGLIALGAGCRERQEPVVAPAAAPATPANAPPVPALAPDAPRLTYPRGSLVEVVAAARASVVALRATQAVRSGPAAMLPGASDAVADVALGTGFIIDAGGEGSYLLTTERIAAAAPELSAVLPGGVEVPVRLVGRDRRLDLALAKLELPPALRVAPLPLGSSDELAVGEELVVLGNPFGDEVIAAAGIVAATGRDAGTSVAQGAAASYRALVQTDARIHRGNSGGPVLDRAGRVIGIATATGDRPTELSFVIPISRVREVLERLRDDGQVTRSWLGALVHQVPAEDGAAPGARSRGALVTQIMAGSPAQKSELAVGDIIVRWAGREVDHRSLPGLVANAPPGRAVEVLVRRGGAERTLAVTLEAMPQ